MLKDNFFTIKEAIDIVNDSTCSRSHEDSSSMEDKASEKLRSIADNRRYRIELNASHPIFQAHFAGNPVMPGACIAQMIKELAEVEMGTPVFIRTVKNMKFLHVINPLESPEISVQLTCKPHEDQAVSVSALISDDERVFSKAILILTPTK